jgi:ATP-dependent exoDNAse (exonuclease V) beta subunit
MIKSKSESQCESNVLIRASAGSGKTFRLSNRYLGLMHHGVSPDEILATTFTRKAAGEILDRVMIRVAQAALDQTHREELASFLNQPALTRDDCLELLRQLVRNLHRLRICTLDAFFAQLASSFSLELGLPPGWRIVETVHDNRLRREAIALTLQSDSQREIRRLLQLMAKGEARRSISSLVQSTVDELYGLYMETDAAAWQRIPKPKMLRDDEVVIAIENLRSAPMPDDPRAATARDGDITAAEQNDWARFVGRGMAAKVLEGQTTYYRKDIPAETITAYQALLTHAKAVLLNQVANQTEATYELLDKFHDSYQQLKHDSRALRFDDVTRSLAHSTALAGIQKQQFRLDTTINHLLLDEFQDTSLAQWHVLRPFARNVAAHRTNGSTQHTSFFCVGDVKQAIYGWRGGLSEIFDALQDELAGLAEESMNVSFRSSQPVIDTVNEAFSNMTRHPNLGSLEEGVTAWCQGFQQHTTTRQQMAGYAELRTAPAAGEGENKHEVRARFAAQRIGQLIAQAPGYSVGVLVRSNEAVARMIYELRQHGIPASEEGGNPLTDSPAVQVLLSLLKLADHPGDTVARYHIARSPLGEQLQYTDHRRLDRALELAQHIRSQLLDDGYGPTILQWARALEPHCDRRDQNRLRQFIALAYAYHSLATLRTADFIAYVESEKVADPTVAAVRVMTVHQAKGLQFDVVVLPDLDSRLSGQPDSCVVGQPSPTEPVDRVCLYRNSSIQKLLPDELQELFATSARRSANEAMCVLYVALTRAVHALYMIIDPSSANENALHKTAAGLLRAALTDGRRWEAEQVAYQCGDQRWCDQEAPRPAAQSVVVPQVRRAVKLASASAESRLDHTSPSQLEGGARIQGNRVLDLRSATATTRGTLIHALFEQITWLDHQLPESSELRHVAERLNTAGLNVTEQLDSFQRMLAMPQIASVLRREFYQAPRDPDLQRALGPDHLVQSLEAHVHNERRFVVRDKGRLLSGIIDRLVLLYDQDHLVAADILDYKTDSVDQQDTDRLDDLVAHYQPQLEAYRRAVAKMYRLRAESIVARLLFVSAGVVRTV